MSLGVRGMAGGGKGYTSFTKTFSNSIEGAGPYTFSYDIDDVHYISMRSRLIDLSKPLTLYGKWVWAVHCDVARNELMTEWLSNTGNALTTEHRKTRMDSTYKSGSTWKEDTYAARISIDKTNKIITITLGSGMPPFLYTGLKSPTDTEYYEYLITVC